MDTSLSTRSLSLARSVQPSATQNTPNTNLCCVRLSGFNAKPMWTLRIGGTLDQGRVAQVPGVPRVEVGIDAEHRGEEMAAVDRLAWSLI